MNKLLVLSIIAIISGCSEPYVCEKQKVIPFRAGEIVNIEYLDETGRIVTSYQYFSGSAKFQCEVESNPDYDIKLSDGALITVSHSDIAKVRL